MSKNGGLSLCWLAIRTGAKAVLATDGLPHPIAEIVAGAARIDCARRV
jgi:hypothetical protein